MSGDTTITGPTQSDWPHLARMAHALNRYHDDNTAPDADTLRRDQHRFIVLVARTGAQSVPSGFAACFEGYEFHSATAFLQIQSLYVDEAWRGHGIGTALLHACEQLATEKGCGFLKIGVRLGNTGAHRLYERYGFLFSSTGPATNARGRKTLAP